MNKQEEILVNLARRHNLTLAQAREVFDLLGSKIADTISDVNKKTDNIYDADKFSIIHIDHLGKFIPNQRKIRHANYCLINKNNQQDDNTDEHNI
jgi:hypothetical protein